MFHRAANVPRNAPGVGLGLSLARRWVEMLGGTGIDVQFQLDRSGTFSFSIPSPLAEDPPAVQLSGPASGGPGLRVMVAEDDRVNRLVLVRLLKNLGHFPIEVTNGRLAVEAWQREGPDLILMDMRMPEVNGLEATR